MGKTRAFFERIQITSKIRCFRRSIIHGGGVVVAVMISVTTPLELN